MADEAKTQETEITNPGNEEGPSEAEKAKKKEYPQPTNDEYLSYYVYQGEWKPTRPIGPIAAHYSSPGPAIVNLPSTLGEKDHDITRPKAPGYKIGQRLTDITDKPKPGPGPGVYYIRDLTNKGKVTDIAPKMGKAARFAGREPGVGTSPGPAAYDRQPSDRIVYPTAPAYTMRGGPRGFMKPAHSPGPNAYDLPNAIGPGKTPYVVGPSYSMGKAERLPDIKRQQNPGPAAYMLPSPNVNQKRPPAYSMGSKAVPPRGASWSPGPQAYGAHMVKYDKYSTPRITFGIRHSPFKAMPGFSGEK